MNSVTTTFRNLLRFTLPLALIGFLVISCNKETVSVTKPAKATEITDPVLKRKLWQKGQELPAVGIYNRTMDEVLVFRSKNDGSRDFSFSTIPASGINFASSNGGQWVWTDEGGIVVITEPQAGMGAGGGTVYAGNTMLDIDFAVCFALGDTNTTGGGLFGPDMGDVAGVIGISGDFEALQNGNFEDGEDPFQYFYGFAYYFVYADDLSDTSYEVLNWIDDLDQPEEDLQDFSFAFIISFQNDGGIYLSKDGDITVNGGSMEFNGNYYAIEGVGFFDDEDGEDASYSTVSGYGTMGCNP